MSITTWAEVPLFDLGQPRPPVSGLQVGDPWPDAETAATCTPWPWPSCKSVSGGWQFCYREPGHDGLHACPQLSPDNAWIVGATWSTTTARRCSDPTCTDCTVEVNP